MSVRWPQNVPRPGVPARQAREEAAREQSKPAEARSSNKPAAKGPTGKPATGGRAGARPTEGDKDSAQGGVHRDGMESGTQRGSAEGLAGGSPRGTPEGLAPGTTRGTTPSAPNLPNPSQAPRLPEEKLARQAPAVPTESPRERDVAEEGTREDARGALEGRAMLRGAVLERLVRGLTEVEQKLATFLENPGRQGVVTLPVVLSESSVTYEFWRLVSVQSDDRNFLAQSLGLPVTADDALLLQTLRQEIHAAFDEFQRSPSGKQARARYEEVLTRYEAARIQPVISGHDTGPLAAECARLQLPCEPEFTRSLLLSPLQLAVALSPEEGTATQVMVAGLTLTQLGALVGHLRRLNPMLGNAQVRQFLLRAATDLKNALRKPLGDAEVERVQELAKQLLRLQAVAMLHV
ncbi:hypothetical protein FJV41_19235 [Myxococcus llanfairpwllgwyngyllgogerychwyrndrobwllllantysiliogogogochensis]|uniref:Uncharacterized protein n=1 Tax=Myxococcus llanfairpwllgwyngyllgogerychwyrndrobwllllantysiliogogogochensis TaxID=2590453 RepID=A0A540WZA7_9BACT|nr:hypothetical protein [Myxococcus llanfairpwllgwyngyllgogerychwyrndrobwllllantysiliogogogochensis]TQF14358.1 hypothetical protein FJV41_19235 [Myxococcus llanfairpwllgwyngyllgogerychwyrndrobwllllantysiliogogogochensis]